MKNLKISADSGAYSLYNEKFAPTKSGLQSDRHLADYSYYKTDEFKRYLDKYIAFLHDNQGLLEFYVCVDIIYNPEASWEIQKYMESCGLSPIPVYHFGEDPKYLKRYMEDHEYIGIGGLGQKATIKTYLEFGDQVFRIVCDKHGTPRRKLHGFAMTSVQLMKRYPWYSCDSSTWISLSRNGWARFPRVDRHGEYDFLAKPVAWRFTERASHTKVHINKQPELHKSIMRRYLHEKFGLDLECMEDYFGRDVCNIGHVLQTGVEIKKWYEQKYGFGEGGNIYLAGTGNLLASERAFKRIITKASRPLPEGTLRHYLGSAYYQRDMETALRALKKTKRRKLRGI